MEVQSLINEIGSIIGQINELLSDQSYKNEFRSKISLLEREISSIKLKIKRIRTEDDYNKYKNFIDKINVLIKSEKDKSALDKKDCESFFVEINKSFKSLKNSNSVPR